MKPIEGKNFAITLIKETRNRQNLMMAILKAGLKKCKGTFPDFSPKRYFELYCLTR